MMNSTQVHKSTSGFMGQQGYRIGVFNIIITVSANYCWGGGGWDCNHMHLEGLWGKKIRTIVAFRTRNNRCIREETLLSVRPGHHHQNVRFWGKPLRGKHRLRLVPIAITP